MEKFRLRLWDRYTTVRNFYDGIAVSFDDLWFDFLAKHFVSEQSSSMIFDQVCREVERYVVRKPEPKSS